MDRSVIFSVRYMSSSVRLSVVCLSVCRLQAIEIFGSVLRHLVRWTSIDFDVKFYGDRRNGTPPLGGGVAKDSDFGP